MTVIAVVAALAVTVGAAVFLREILRRRRRIRRLRRSEAAVATSLEEGRLSPDTGQALLQHLEGLRRECSGSNGD